MNGLLCKTLKRSSQLLAQITQEKAAETESFWDSCYEGRHPSAKLLKERPKVVRASCIQPFLGNSCRCERIPKSFLTFDVNSGTTCRPIPSLDGRTKVAIMPEPRGKVASQKLSTVSEYRFADS